MYAVLSIQYLQDVYVKATGSSTIKLLSDLSYHQATNPCQGDVRKFTFAAQNFQGYDIIYQAFTISIVISRRMEPGCRFP